MTLYNKCQKEKKTFIDIESILSFDSGMSSSVKVKIIVPHKVIQNE